MHNRDFYYFYKQCVKNFKESIFTSILAESMFLAIINETSVSISSGDPIIWDAAPINPGGNFNPALGLYQAPVHGYYT